MIVTRSVKHHVTMGNYEWVEFGAEVVLDTNEKGSPVYGKTAAEAGDIAQDLLDDMLSNDIHEARVNTDEEGSYIHLYQQKDK